MNFSDAIKHLWPHGNSKIPGLVEGIAAAAPTAFPKYGLTTKTAVCQAMAQFSHECGAGTEMVENTNYTAQRAAEVWPIRGSSDYRHFANADDCYKKCRSFPGDPEFHKKLINLVYGDRNGNHAGTDDGWNFIGRGLPQLTGRENYERCGTKVGLDLITQPNLASSPAFALEIGCADFVLCGCLPYALKDDTLNTTKHLNGGTVGLSERESWLAQWKRALADQPEVMYRAEPQPHPEASQPVIYEAAKAPPVPPVGKLGRQHVAAGGVIVATGAATKVALDAGVPSWVVAIFVIVGIFVAFLTVKKMKG